jgi:hypothetical protein
VKIPCPPQGRNPIDDEWGAERGRHDTRTEGHDGAFQCTSPCFRAFVLPGGPLRPGLPNGFAAVRTVPTDGRLGDAINAFIISRRFQDEVAEKRRVDDLENRLNEALELNERYGKRLEELVASQQGNN